MQAVKSWIVRGAVILAALGCEAQSARPGMGAIPYGSGVTFRVWAPFASSVTVRGDFNSWGNTALVSEGNGNWSADVAAAKVGDAYKYYLNGSLYRRDPRSRRVTNSAGNSLIYDPNAFDWDGQTFETPSMDDLVIYEFHPGTYNAESYVPSTFDKDIERLDHLQGLGVNAVEVMPMCEFPSDKSWGYNPADLFAVESALGGADAFKRFVKACHARGIAVLLDVVHNHYGPNDLSLWQFDGWSQNSLGGIYFYNSTDGKAYTWWGNTRPDFGRTEVRDFIKDQIRMWLGEYRVDGFRWDSAFNIIYYNDGANHNADGESLLRDINWEIGQNYPGKIRIAEDHAFDYSMNFDGMWHVAFHNDLKGQITPSSDANRDMNVVANLIGSWPSHNRVIFSESHDEVGDLNSKHRLPYDIDSGSPDSIYARKRALLAAGVVLTSPGVPMLFQGQEMHEWYTFSAEQSLRWALTNSNAGIVRAYRAMIRARRNLDNVTLGLKGTGVAFYHFDNSNKILGYHRYPGDTHGEGVDVFVLANFSNTPWTNGSYAVTFPYEGAWTCRFNGDSSSYGGDFGNVGSASVVAAGDPPQAMVDMGRYSLMIFSRGAGASAGVANFTPAQPTGCDPVVIAYDSSEGPLRDAAAVNIHIGRNNWQDTVDVPMVRQGSAWVYTNAVLAGTYRLDCCFNDGMTWDNNHGADWHVTVAGCPAGDTRPLVLITNPVSDITVANAVVSYDLKGLCNSNTVGNLLWTNTLTGAAGACPAAAEWLVNGVVLGVGTNLIHVFGTNVPQRSDAWDSATNAAYGAAWNTGSDGGYGWGGGWNLVASGASAGFYLASAEANQYIAPKAWALWANGTGLAEAMRPLARALSTSEVLSVKYENNWITTGSSVGIGLRNGAGTNLFEFMFIGGGSNYVINDRIMTRATSIPWTSNGLSLAFQMLNTTNYRFMVNSTGFTGTLASATDYGVATFRAWNYAAGPGMDYNYYLTDLKVAGGPAMSTVVTDSVQIVREPASSVKDSDHDGLPDSWELQFFYSKNAAQPAADSDGDGLNNLQEYQLGTNPKSAASTFRLTALRFAPSQPGLSWTSVGGKTYKVLCSDGPREPFSDLLLLAETNAPAGVETSSHFLDTGAYGPGPFTNAVRWYRVKLVIP